jgi:hypothetical protein
MRCVVVEMPRIVQCFDFRLNTAVTALLIFLTMGKETAIRMNEAGGSDELVVLGVLLKNI